MAQFDMKKLDTNDKIVAGAGVVTLICLFLPWWGIGPYSESGFGSGFGIIGALLIIAAAVYLVMLRSGSNMPKNAYGPGVTVLALSLVGIFIVALRWLTIPKGFGYVLSYRLFKASGEKVPWEN
jgi:hypothetical protein